MLNGVTCWGLLPGLDGTGLLFDPLLESLPESLEANVIDYPRDQVLDSDALVEMVARRFPRDAPHVVVAESFSGPIAIRYACQRQQDVKALVLCASFLQNPLPAALRSLPRAAHTALFSLPMPSLVARTLLVGLDASPGLVNQVQQAVAAVEGNVLAARVRSLTAVDVTEQCSQLEMPVLYLQASDDQLVGSRGAEQVKRALPRTEIRKIDAPHLVLQTRPAEAVDAIMTFLEAVGVQQAPLNIPGS